MKKTDRIKSIFAICMISAVVISFVYFGKDDPITRWLAASGIVIWLGIMYYTSRKDKKNTPNN